MNNFEHLLKFCFLEIFVINKCLEFTLISFGILKYDCIIKTIEMFNFLLLINSSVTIEFSFLFSIISAMISSKTINILGFFTYIVFFNIVL